MGFYGARFSGAGFRGCCIALVDPQKSSAAMEHIRTAYRAKYPELSKKCLGLYLSPRRRSQNPVKAIILAAGYATRLYPLTKNFPKPLLEVGGKTILDHLIDQLKTISDIDRAYLVSNPPILRPFCGLGTRKGRNASAH